ncbi:MAG: zinc ribbon domain-containing protein [Thermoplasmata archaeon]|nr:zinc ribbon domain-containing protein [Thermoplasmata archaeon]
MKFELGNLRKVVEKSIIIKVVVIILVIFLNVAAYIAATCLVPIAGVLFTFGIPVLLGWKNIKFLLGFGVPVIIGTAIVVAAYQTNYVQTGQEAMLGDDAGCFSNGTVSPYKGNPGDAFNFTVEIKKENSTHDTVYLIRSKDLYILDDPMEEMTKYWEDNATARYYYNTTVEKSMIWYYTFSVLRNYQNGSSVWLNVTKGGQQMIRVGPVTMGYNEMLFSFIGVYLLNTMLMLGVGYYLLVSMYWWFGKAKQRREAILREMEAQKETEGQKIEELEKKKTLKCSSCGAMVDEGAEKCWKCGEKFEK